MVHIIRSGIISFFIILLWISGCSDSRSSQENTRGKEEPEQIRVSRGDSSDIKVTFVELGSVKCIPCKMMQPVMEEIEKEYGSQVNVVFHDVWTEAGKPFGKEYKIRIIPTQIFLDSEGKEYFRHEGFFPKEEVVKILKQKGVL